MDLRDVQRKIDEFTRKKGITAQVETRIIDLNSEIGELSKEVLKGTDYGKKHFSITNDWKSEIGDVLFSLICIANESKIDLCDCLDIVLDKYENRFANNGNIGSGR